MRSIDSRDCIAFLSLKFDEQLDKFSTHLTIAFSAVAWVLQPPVQISPWVSLRLPTRWNFIQAFPFSEFTETTIGKQLGGTGRVPHDLLHFCGQWYRHYAKSSPKRVGVLGSTSVLLGGRRLLVSIKDVVDVAEQKRLNDAREAGIPWKKWGPYLSERQWGTVREDYSSRRKRMGLFLA